MSKKKETVRVDESGPPPEVMAQQIIAESAQPAAPAAAMPQEGAPVARRRGRPPGSGKNKARDYKAERAARAARTGTSAGVPATAEQAIADLQTRAAPLATQIHRIAGPIIRRWTPDDPYTEEEAMQVACAIIPVSDKHADKVGAAGPEIGLAIIVGMQLLGRYLAVAERERARKEHERGLPVSANAREIIAENPNVPDTATPPVTDPRFKNFVQNPK